MKALFVLMFMCLSISQLSAQFVFRSLEEVWNYADQHNIDVAIADGQKQIAKQAVKQAYGNLLPTVNLNAGLTDNILIQPTLVPAELFGGEPGTFVEEEFGKRYNYNANLTAQVDIINASNWKAIKTSRYEEEVSASNLAKAKQNLYNLSAQAYYTFQLMHEMESLVEESLHASKNTWKHAQQLYQNGQISEISLNETAIQVKKAMLHLTTARQNQTEALNQLKQLLNINAHDSIRIEDPLIMSESVEPIALELSSSTDVKLSYARMLVAKNSLSAARSAYLPTLAGVFSMSTQLAGNEFMNFSSSNNLPQQYWGLRLSIPLFANNVRSFQVAKAKIDLDLTRKQYETTRQRVSIEDENLQTGFQHAQTSLRDAREILELHFKNDQHASRKLTSGLISTDERLMTYQAYINYKNEYLQYLSDYLIKYYQMQVRQKTLKG